MRRWAGAAVLVALGAGAACEKQGDLPPTAIVKPRVLAIVAEPPAVAPGESATVTLVTVGAGGAAPEVSWSRCRIAPRPGDAVNPDCLATPPADGLEPIGDGVTITTTMPADVTAAALGQPDASGGVYLPLVARATFAGVSLIATYRLRLASAGDTNQNPVLTGLSTIAAGGTAIPIDEANPPAVRAGDRLSLLGAVADGSVESYPAPLGGAPALEMLLTSWFSSAGRFSLERSEGPQPATVLELDERLPAPGNAIDVFAVTRDDRGGVAYVHRTLVFEQ